MVTKELVGGFRGDNVCLTQTALRVGARRGGWVVLFTVTLVVEC